jgi:hypothetical protein
VLERQHKAAAAGAKAAKKAVRQQARAANLAAAAAAKAAKKAVRQQARAANLAVYTALLPFGVVESNKSLFTGSNWGMVGNDTCPTCGWLPKGCFCSL